MTGVAALLHDVTARAAGRLAPEVVDYVTGGSGSEVTLDEAAAAWRSYRLAPHVLRDVSAVDPAIDLLGARLPAPIGIAPIGYQALLHEDAEVATAAGAGGHLLVVSTRASRSVEEVAAAVTGPWWLQVYVLRDRGLTTDLVRRAAAAGAGALVLTGDTPYVARKRRAGRLVPVEAEREQSAAVTAEEIARLAGESGLPVLVKGVLRADDARRCLDAGAAGLIVSNHGGRQLDRAVATAHALPGVVAAAGDAPVLVDGGIRDGLDVLVALALGARAVLLGRPLAWALAAGGAEAVAGLLAAFTDEFAHVLGLAGYPDCAAIERELIVSGPRSGPP